MCKTHSVYCIYRSAEAEKKKNILKKMYAEKEDAEIMALAGITHHPGPSFKQVTASQGMSTAVDARLELGLETQSELKLKVRLEELSFLDLSSSDVVHILYI